MLSSIPANQNVTPEKSFLCFFLQKSEETTHFHAFLDVRKWSKAFPSKTLGMIWQACTPGNLARSHFSTNWERKCNIVMGQFHWKLSLTFSNPWYVDECRTFRVAGALALHWLDRNNNNNQTNERRLGAKNVVLLTDQRRDLDS